MADKRDLPTNLASIIETTVVLGKCSRNTIHYSTGKSIVVAVCLLDDASSCNCVSPSVDRLTRCETRREDKHKVKDAECKA
jgi:hypothetical protein